MTCATISVENKIVNLDVESNSCTSLDVNHIQNVLSLSSVGIQGVQGEKGEIGNSAIEYVAGENITSYQPLIIDDGVLKVASNIDDSHTGKFIGLASNSSNLGGDVTVLFHGEVENSGWNFTLGNFIYIGANGLITDTTPSIGFLQSIGHASATNKIILNIKQAIRRI